MEYTVVCNDGTEQKFYIREYAEMYVRVYGGRLVGKPELTLVQAA